MIDPELVRRMPKVELHVHLEGSIRPATVLELARRNGVALPAQTVEALTEWYRFRDFPHFVEVYVSVSKTIQTPDDVELIAREFLVGQKEQNILHSEVTYTASTIEKYNGIPWAEQWAALQRAIAFGERELGITCGFIIDIVRGDPPLRALQVAEWAVGAQGQGVVALGLAGEEGRARGATYQEAFDYARRHGLPVIPHAGETQGAWSIADVLEHTHPPRIGHGVRCLEDPAIVEELRDRGVTLEVCPSSNVCLNVFPSLAEHPLPKLLEAGLKVTINSDDPPMFSTSLTEEYQRLAATFGYQETELRAFTRNAIEAALVDDSRKASLLAALEYS